MLKDREWAAGYDTDEGSLSEQFYVPVLSEAVRYDRGTGYFGAGSLARNARGIEGLVRNGGRMRLLVGCTLRAEEIDAVRRGESLRKQVERNLCSIPLDPPDANAADGLEMLAWMVAAGRMEIKVAVRCDDSGAPVAGDRAIYHKKLGIARDRAGDAVAWRGSDNETPSGQSGNSESLSVFASWKHPDHARHIEGEFEADWSGRRRKLAVMDVPEAAARRLLAHAPPAGRRPARLERGAPHTDPGAVWSFIARAHELENGDMVGLATAPVKPWPHQVQVLRRLLATAPARLLIADEVGLGKTIQAGLFLRQAWLEGRRRILVMAPKGLTGQWQAELRSKLNLDWPAYDGEHLVWRDTHAGGPNRRKRPDDWTACGPVIISSQLARRDDRAQSILDAEWDVVVLDEAHYARQTDPANPRKRTPNKTLKLMRRLRHRTRDLVLLTATPMQLHPVELYDLLDLLGLPKEWNWPNFEKFYGILRDPDPADIPFAGAMLRASEGKYGPVDPSGAGVPKLRGGKVLGMLRGDRKARLLGGDMDAIRAMLLLCSPVTRLVSRNTRRRLRDNIMANDTGWRPEWRLGTRNVADRFVEMSGPEREAYDAVDGYIRSVWNGCRGPNRSAVGFALAVYRKRLTSSFAALGKTLENHLARMDGGKSPPAYGDAYGEGYEDEDGDPMDEGEIAESERAALTELDRERVGRLLGMIRGLPPDTKFDRMAGEIKTMRRDGYRRVMVFTQFTDTMDFLRDRLRGLGRVACYSGRGGEEPGPGGAWRAMSREETRARFLDGSADILVCTDAAAEGLNFQSCGAVINYDMPWNPMRVEQRIGRVDRIGQRHEYIRIVNMYYGDTIEAKVHRVLRERVRLFEDVVGSLQPVLADGEMREMVLAGDDAAAERAAARGGSGLDLDGMLAADTSGYEQPVSPVTMEDLDRIVRNGTLMRRYGAEPAGRGQHSMDRSGRRVRVTADRELFEGHVDSMEFWSPGSPAFPELNPAAEPPKHGTLKQLLDSLERRE